MVNQLKNDRVLKALRREPVDKTPVWVMRQAGRYLPEYRKVRSSVSGFMELCKTPELACEVTMQPINRFDLDAAILFSDILTIPDALGTAVNFIQGQGPNISQTIRSHNDLKLLELGGLEERLHYVYDTIKLLKTEIADRVPLLGFTGSPWTVACYMVEGKSSKDFSVIKQMLYNVPELLHELLDTLSQAITRHLQAQIQAGVNAVMIFDTWGGILTPPAFHDFSLTHTKNIIKNLKTLPNCPPIVLFGKNQGQWLNSLADSGADALGIDWTIDIGMARQQVGDKVALQGNLDPAILTAAPKQIEAEVEKILAAYGKGSGHVFNLGHGITPNIEPEHLHVMIEAVHNHSIQYH